MRFCQLAAVAVAAATPAVTRAVVFQATSDSNYNTAAPGGALANSGWQYQFNWAGGFLGTPVAPHYFVTAKHIIETPPYGVGQSISYNGQSYTVQEVMGTWGDLRLFRVNNEFLSFAPMWNSSVTADGSESGKSVVVHGRGGPRGTEVRVGNSPGGALLGWNHVFPTDGKTRWGQNTVLPFVGNQAHLEFSFSPSGHGDYTGASEAGLVLGDSGGGLFIQSSTGEWKLAGINWGFLNNQQYRYTSNGSLFTAALYDTRGLYDVNGLLVTGVNEVPSKWVASRIAPNLSNINALVDLNSTWKVDASSTWESPGNWSSSTPAGAGSTADFRTVISQPRTVTLGSNKTVGRLNFDNLNRYTLNGNTIIFDTGGAGNARVMVASGSHTIASQTALNNNLDVLVHQSNSTLTLSGNVSATNRTITKTGDGAVEFKNVRAATLDVQKGSVKILPDGSTNGTSKVNTLPMSANTKLDLTNNDLVVVNGTLGTHTGGSNYNGLTGLVDTGRGAGNWTGNGITSSTAASDPPGTRGLGIALASDALSFTSGTKLWSGQTVTPGSVLIKYTHVGDLDLNGVINADDYWRIDSGYSRQLKGYANGDLNYSGAVDGDDYFAMDQNYSGQLGVVLRPAAVEGATAVPEPSSLAVACAFAAPLLLRRRARRS